LGIGHSARVSVPNPLARIWPNGVMPNFLDNNMQLGEVLWWLYGDEIVIVFW
jgi:hypothetical protein